MLTLAGGEKPALCWRSVPRRGSRLMRRRLQPWWVSVAVTAPFSGLVTLVQGTDGGLYGTTDNLGDGPGTVFRLGTNGTLTTVYKFCSLPNCADGDLPISGVIVGTDGNLYGVTYEGGANDYGTVFRLTLSGSLTTLYSFCNLTGCTDGRNPYGGLVEGSDGNLYGTTAAGGTSEGGTGAGTIFKITSAGLLKTLYTFCPQGGLCSDGASPQAALTEGADGSFYGSTFGGGGAESFRYVIQNHSRRCVYKLVEF